MVDRVLIVEDEVLIAMTLEDAVIDCGYEVVGPVSSSIAARKISSGVRFALVDVNLADGPTGPELGVYLASQGITVVYMTANPEAVRHGPIGTTGVLPKPLDSQDVCRVLDYLSNKANGNDSPTPHRLELFTRSNDRE